jgi:hypothetical protein
VSWSLSASGHVDDPGLEAVLAAKVGELLEAEGTQVSYASFSSSSFAGDPRELARQPLQETAPGEVTE